MVLAGRITEIDDKVGVLMTTGYNEELVGEGHARTNADILAKPYRRSDLLDRIRQALNNRGANVERRGRSEYGAIEA